MSSLISAQELLDIIDNPSLRILDIRGSLTDAAAGKLLFKASHIPHAQCLSMAEDVRGTLTGKNGRTPLVEPEQFKATLERLGITNDMRVVIYDAGAFNFAPRLWFTLRSVGHVNVEILNGGFKAWEKAGFPLSTETEKFPATTYTVKPGIDRVFSMKEIQENLTTRRYKLIDARGENVYLGLDPGQDPVGGHIPGSVSHPSSLNVASTGLLKDKNTLKTEFLELSNGKPETIIHTCGSGVAACGNMFAMHQADLPYAGIYVGSFSEWISVKSNPISTEDED